MPAAAAACQRTATSRGTTASRGSATSSGSAGSRGASPSARASRTCNPRQAASPAAARSARGPSRSCRTTSSPRFSSRGASVIDERRAPARCTGKEYRRKERSAAQSRPSASRRRRQSVPGLEFVSDKLWHSYRDLRPLYSQVRNLRDRQNGARIYHAASGGHIGPLDHGRGVDERGTEATPAIRHALTICIIKDLMAPAGRGSAFRPPASRGTR
jgi:hypothetical protein